VLRHIDLGTLMLLSVLVICICAVLFVANTAFVRGDPSGRMWSLAFVSVLISGVAYGIPGLGGSGWWVAVGHSGLVVAIGGFWSGMRLHNERSSLFWIVGVGASVVALTTVLFDIVGVAATGLMPRALAVAVLAGLGCWESTRGRLGRNVNGRLLAVGCGTVSAFALLRAVVLLVKGENGPVFSQDVTGGITAFVALTFVIIVTVCVSVLRAEQRGATTVSERTCGSHTAAGALASFTQSGVDHVDRAFRHEVGLALIGAEVDNLPAINAAFGRAAGDEAIDQFAETLRAVMPVMSLIWHRESGRFLVLARAASPKHAELLVGRIQTALVQNPLAQLSSIRLTASFGIADTYSHGHDLVALQAAVDGAVRVVQAGGGNGVSVAAPPTAAQTAAPTAATGPLAAPPAPSDR